MFSNQNIELLRVEQRANSGARWFFWIAALSMVTSIVNLSGSKWGFIISLGVTQVINGFAIAAAAQWGSTVTVMAIFFDVLATGLFAGIGFLALKRHLWAFIVGLILFGLDGLVLVFFQDWIGVAFHALVIYWIFGGFNACRKLLALQNEAAQQQAMEAAANLNTGVAPAGDAPSGSPI